MLKKSYDKEQLEPVQCWDISLVHNALISEDDVSGEKNSNRVITILDVFLHHFLQ